MLSDTKKQRWIRKAIRLIGEKNHPTDLSRLGEAAVTRVVGEPQGIGPEDDPRRVDRYNTAITASDKSGGRGRSSEVC